MRRLLILSSAALILSSVSFAQPAIIGISNIASFAHVALPNGSIARGSMFAVFGSNLGPAEIVVVSTFPLSFDLGGTSGQVTVAGTTLDLIMIFTLDRQVAVILPSNTPLGSGTLTITFNGQTSAPFPIRVTDRSFGIFAINQGGSGTGIVTDPDFAVNTLFHSANPGGTWIIWGTGIGPVAGDERSGPLPGDMPEVDVQVLVGGKPAKVGYRGRSGCCAGVDQIVFEIPLGVFGCYVPVVVVIQGLPSNFVTISIVENGSTCSDPDGLTSADLATAQTNNELRIGSIQLSRDDVRFPLPGPLPPIQAKSDTGTASFGRYDTARLIAAESIPGLSGVGACLVYQFSGVEAVDLDPVAPDPLDAGANVTVAGPLGNRQLAQQNPGVYSAQLGGGLQAIPGLPGGGLPDYLEAGAYTVSNGNGGADVGQFMVNIDLPGPLSWTNQAAINSVTRSQGVTVNWTGGDPATEVVVIAGNSVAVSANVGAGFVCRESVSAGSFLIPPEVLGALPLSEIQEGLPTGFLSVGTSSKPTRFNVPGLDVAFVSYNVLNTSILAYQ